MISLRSHLADAARCVVLPEDNPSPYAGLRLSLRMEAEDSERRRRAAASPKRPAATARPAAKPLSDEERRARAHEALRFAGATLARDRAARSAAAREAAKASWARTFERLGWAKHEGAGR